MRRKVLRGSTATFTRHSEPRVIRAVVRGPKGRRVVTNRVRVTRRPPPPAPPPVVQPPDDYPGPPPEDPAPPEFPDPKWRPTGPITPEQHEVLTQRWFTTINAERAARGLRPVSLRRDLEHHYRDVAREYYFFDDATRDISEVFPHAFGEFMCGSAGPNLMAPRMFSESFLHPDAVSVGMGHYFEAEPGTPEGVYSAKQFSHVFGIFLDY